MKLNPESQIRHSRENGNPGSNRFGIAWIPACAGMTQIRVSKLIFIFYGATLSGYKAQAEKELKHVKII
jgi:hypothetical protein